MMAWLAVIAGVILLALGAELLIRGGSSIARRLGLSDYLIGLTICAWGTSAPELSVAVRSALQGTPELAVGNIVGANIYNPLVVLGIVGILRPFAVRSIITAREFPLLAGATVLAWLLAIGGISRWEGALLLVVLAAYTVWSYMAGRAEPSLEEDPALAPPDVPAGPGRAGYAAAAGMLIGGACLLLGGSRVLLHGVEEIAARIGLSPVLAGLLIASVATAMPELAASVAAALRRQPEIAVGNVLGSNLFNLLGILGTTAVIAPTPISSAMLRIDFPAAVLAVALTWVACKRDNRLVRVEAAALVVVYIVYAGLRATVFRHA